MLEKNDSEKLIEMADSMHVLVPKTAPNPQRRRAKLAAQLTAALSFCVLSCSLSATAFAAAAADAEEWIQLFNGRDLEGWTPRITGHEYGENFGDTFRVENGVLKVSYDEYESFDGRFGHLFYKEPFSHYRLRIEYRFVGEQLKGHPGDWAMRNSGVMFHSQSGSSMLRDQDFPICVEAQFLGGLSDGRDRPTFNMCSPGSEIVYDGSIYPDHCLNSKSKTFHGDQWVQGELLVLGSGQITHYVDGEKVLEYALPQMGGGAVNHFDPKQFRAGELLDGGYIALQSESHPIEFRKVELLNLEGCMDRNASNYKRYYVKSNPAACKYEEASH